LSPSATSAADPAPPEDPAAYDEAALRDAEEEYDESPRRSYAYGERNGQGDEPEAASPQYVDVPGPETITAPEGDSAGGAEPDAAPFAPEETSAAGTKADDGFDDENEDPESEQ
jgi:hypothetical protein